MRRALAVAATVGELLALPAPAMAHALRGTFRSPLPLAAYLAGAAAAVAMVTLTVVTLWSLGQAVVEAVA